MLELIPDGFSQVWTEIDVGIGDGDDGIGDSDDEIAHGNEGIAASAACTGVEKLSL